MASASDLLALAMQKQAESLNAAGTGVTSQRMIYNIYRPTTLDQMVGQDLLREEVRNWFEHNTIPRFTIFYSDGIPGVGKDVLADIIARHILGIPPHMDPRKDTCKRYIVLNCKAEGGIDAVRKAIDTVSVPPIQLPGYVPHYVLNLTELQGLSEGALEAILQISENPPAWLWIVATTTDLAKVKKTSTSKSSKGVGSSPLASRAVVKHLDPISVTDITKRLQYVADKEGIYKEDAVNSAVLTTIAAQSGGSVRTALSLLEGVRYGTTTTDVLAQLDSVIMKESFPVKQMATALVYEFYYTEEGNRRVDCVSFLEKYQMAVRYVNASQSGEGGRAALISVIGGWLGINEDGVPSEGLAKALTGKGADFWPKGDGGFSARTDHVIGPAFVRAINVLTILTNAGLMDGVAHESKARLLCTLAEAAKKVTK